jgi:AraC-like DNA-binding protein
MDLYSHISAIPGVEETFAKLALLLDTTVANNTISIPASKGKGIIKKFQAAKGLTVIDWDLCLHEAFTFQRKEAFSDKKGLSILYVFTRKEVTITETREINGHKQELNNIIFASADTSLELIINPLKPVRIIDMIITDEWLENEYAINNRLPYPFYAILMKQKEPVLFTEPAFCNVYNMLSDIYRNSSAETPDSFYIRTKTLSILSNVFESVGSRNTPGYKNDLLMHDKMILVEQVLEEHLDKTLPSIKTIARQVALSESTLKRNFKALYDTTIYEFYLQQKMKRARALFDENPRSVKEVAYMLGYEKVSNFIDMFKKHYHFLPGDLRKIGNRKAEIENLKRS